MKIIISSKELNRIASKAITGIYNKVHFNESKIEIIQDKGLGRKTLKTECFHVLKNSETFTVRFDYFKWMSLNKFLELIPEQLIVIEFNDNGFDLLHIEITECVANF